MVLLKRRADGTYSDWRIPDNPTVSSSPNTPSKKRRLDSSSNYDHQLFTSSSSPRQNGTQGSRRTKSIAKSPSSSQFRNDSLHHQSLPSSSSISALLPSSSSSSVPSTSQAARTSSSNTEPKEKRLARFKPKCPQGTLERLHRYFSQSQRIYMIDRSRDGDALSETFIVQGSTGNVYTVVIDNLPRCDCPDYQKGNHCKHILFIFMKVLQVPQSSSHWYQKALLTSELAEIFAAAPLPPQLRGSFVANERVVSAWCDATGRTPSTPTKAGAEDPRRVPSAEDDCPICYDSMGDEHGSIQVLEKSLVWCESCHNAVHKECWNNWRTTKQKQGEAVTCVYCRSPWTNATAGSRASGSAAGYSEGYLNLSQVSGVSPERDTSTYYNGPRRSGSYAYGYRSYLY